MEEFESINRAGSIPELRQLRLATFRWAEKMAPGSGDRDIGQINARLDALIRRTVLLCEQTLASEGFGKPPKPYAFLLLGSGGRREQTLWSDQDNALIIEDIRMEEDESAIRAYFARLADRIVRSLALIGFPPCDGKVVASNPMWRKTESEWRGMLLGWIEAPIWEQVRYLLIASDMRFLSGDPGLAIRLRRQFRLALEDRPMIYRHMLRNTLHHQPALNLLGQLVKVRYGEEAGGIDIKRGCYLPLINAVRLLALMAGVEASATLERAEALKLLSPYSAEAEDWIVNAESILAVRNMCGYKELEDGTYIARPILRPEGQRPELLARIKRCAQLGIELQKALPKWVAMRTGEGT